MSEKLIEQFYIFTEDGDRIRINGYQQMISAGHFKDPDATIPGMKRLETDDGDVVTMRGEVYHVIATGETGRRVVANEI